jgi:hypothetical protein
MKRTFCLLAVASIALVLAGFVAAQKQGGKRSAPATIREEAPTNVAAAPAPAECAALVRALVAYVSHEKPDITTDSAAQNRWLSESLRKALAHRLEAYKEYAKKNADSPEGPPGNADFVGSWDYPTTFSIVGSRLEGVHAVVDVTFTWGPETQYPGDKRLTSYAFVREGNAWKLDDIYTFRGEFVEASSLMATFSRDQYP